MRPARTALRPRASRLPAGGLCLALGSLVGCGAGPRMRTVEPQLTFPPGAKLAIVVDAPTRLRSDYPEAPGQLLQVVANEFARVKAQGPLRDSALIDVRSVVAYQFRNLDWRKAPPARVARDLGADYILWITMHDFSTRAAGADLTLLQGELLARAEVHDASLGEADSVLWPGARSDDGDFYVRFPEDGPVGQLSGDDTRIRLATMALFANRLVKRFYTHEAPAAATETSP